MCTSRDICTYSSTCVVKETTEIELKYVRSYEILIRIVIDQIIPLSKIYSITNLYLEMEKILFLLFFSLVVHAMFM